MKKILAVMVALGFLFGLGTTLQAAPTAPKKPIVYPGKTEPSAVFDHAKHKASCTECHPKLFKMKANGSGIKMADITAGKSCGTCHNGTKAFSAKDKASCKRCHTGGK